MTGELVLVANAGDATVSAFILDAAGQRLVPLATSAVGRGCSTFAVDEARDLVYANTKGDADGAGEGIDVFRLDRDAGTLEQVGHRDTEGNLAYLALAHDGAVLAGAAYHAGFAATWCVDGTGGIGEPVARVDWPNAHCVAAVEGNLYVVSLGADAIGQYALSPTGELTPLDPVAAEAPAGSGPRHLVLGAEGARAFVVTEFSGEVLTYDRDPATGALILAGAAVAHASDRGLGHSRYGADPRAEHLIWGADVHLARGGHVLLASERTESTIASLRVDAGGRVGDLVEVLDTERQPRGFAVSRDGRYAVVAGEASTDVSLVAIGADGSLRTLSYAATGRGANWVRTLPRG